MVVSCFGGWIFVLPTKRESLLEGDEFGQPSPMVGLVACAAR